MRAKKSLGQNFLTDKTIAEKIIAAAGIRAEDNVWEIGPGKGILTDILVQKECRLTCFELDRDLTTLLQERLGAKIDLINEDILKTDWKNKIERTKQLISNGEIKGKNALVANIPYNITSPLLGKLMHHSDFFQVIVLMLQKEVAQRLASLPGRKSYGALSIKTQFYFEVETLFQVPAIKFKPQPRVDSMLVRLKPRTKSPLPDNYTNNRPAVDLFWRVIETCFHSRRKTIKNNLKNILSKSELESLEQTLEDRKSKICPQIGTMIGRSIYDLSARGEELSETDYIDLCNAIISIRSTIGRS